MGKESLLESADVLKSRIDDYAHRVFPKTQEFEEVFLGNLLSAVIICSDDDFSLRSFCDHDLLSINEKPAYFDLSEVTEGDYRLILRELSYGVAESGILLDNIDRIPDIPDREDLEFLVRMALKRDTFPTEIDRPIEVLDFSNIRVGVRCSRLPDYLKGKSMQAYFVSVEPLRLE